MAPGKSLATTSAQPQSAATSSPENTHHRIKAGSFIKKPIARALEKGL